MKLTFDLKEEDWLHFNLYHLRNSQSIKKTIQKRRISTSLSLIAFGVVLGFGINPGSFTFEIFLSMVVVSILMFLIFPKYVMYRMKKRLKVSIKDEAKNTMFTDYEFEFTDDGIVERTPFNITKMSWQAISSFQEDDDYFYLYLHAANAYVIPKAACEYPAELRELVNESIG